MKYVTINEMLDALEVHTDDDKFYLYDDDIILDKNIYYLPLRIITRGEAKDTILEIKINVLEWNGDAVAELKEIKRDIRHGILKPEFKHHEKDLIDYINNAIKLIGE